MERPVFETARERRAEQEKISEQMAHEEEDVDLHQASYEKSVYQCTSYNDRQ